MSKRTRTVQFALNLTEDQIAQIAPELKAQRDDLLAACKAFIELFTNSDMRPEDECHVLYWQMKSAVAKAEGAEAARERAQDGYTAL